VLTINPAGCPTLKIKSYTSNPPPPGTLMTAYMVNFTFLTSVTGRGITVLRAHSTDNENNFWC